ncbi:MAG: hypothetical protein U9R42_06270 [Bacteroidota bacterium]|nr:hypothetical protein [Bacteroidota bacterium]
MKRLKFKILLLFAIIFPMLLFFQSCIDDIKDFENIRNIKMGDWKPEIAVPLIHAELSIFDFVKGVNYDSLYHVGNDNMVSLIYKGSSYSAYAKDYINIPNQNFSTGPFNYHTSGLDSILLLKDIEFDSTMTHDYSFNNNEEIKKIIFKDGILEIDIESTFARSGEIRVEIPSLKRVNGDPFFELILFTYNGQGKVTVNKQIDLDSFSLDLTKQNTTFNAFKVHYNILMFGTSNFVHKNDRVKVEIKFKDVDFSYIQGYLGQHKFNYHSDTTHINLFESTEVGEIHFENPHYNIYVYNTVGIPITLKNPVIKSYSETQGVATLTGSAVDNPVYINYPSISNPGKIAKTGIYMNKTNSNIQDLIRYAPGKMSSDFTLQSNQGGVTYNNFATDSSHFDVKTELELPLYGYTNDWEVFLDTDFEIENIDQIESLLFNLLVINGFPVEADVQLYFIDSTDNVFDSLIHTNDYVFRSGVVGANYRVEEPSVNLTVIEFDKARLDNLSLVRKIRVRANLSTTNSGNTNIKIYSDYIFDIKLSLKTKMKVDVL